MNPLRKVKGFFNRTSWKVSDVQIVRAPSPRSATCSLIPSFQPLVIHACGDWVLWTSNIVNVLVSSSCPSAHMNGVWIHMAATNLTMLCLALVPGISLLTSLYFSTFATPKNPDPAVLCAVSKLNKEGMIANIIKLNVPRNDARDHAPGRQGVRDDSLSFEAF